MGTVANAAATGGAVLSEMSLTGIQTMLTALAVESAWDSYQGAVESAANKKEAIKQGLLNQQAKMGDNAAKRAAQSQDTWGQM